ncbi:putative aldouronate transport system permease protein [Paenibacillus endophyticus]|uniref:Putative aldouronate transport system permease protein n=1 Tax=Paenibacillus endophyticus TaxID=1294268 RepID=A0A7W5C7V3_9BACL|nr:ABC transporter permease subunit [Paenibacillus endophyticus]MBB3152325.1 putative aldouronate transport system permease protein [Paenibacillus endophyticus]
MSKATEQIKLASYLPQAKRRGFFGKLIKQQQLLIMSVPFVLIALVFSYGPLWGWIMAFQDYKIGKGVLGSSFVGFDNFVKIFQDEQFYFVMRNTLAMSFMGLIASFVGSIVLALLLNEVRKTFFKRAIQTITYIPHFVSWVVIANVVTFFLSPDGGLLNVIMMKLKLINEPIYFMIKGEWFWIIHTLASLWKELGWSTIIYLAVLMGLNPEHYEAAEMDGASRFRKMWHISIPGLMPTAILLLTMSIGWAINSGFESQFVLGNPAVIEYSDVIDLYALRYSTQLSDYSYGMAINMFKSVISVLMVLSVTYLAKKTQQSRLF